MDLGLKEGCEAGLAQLLTVFGADDEGSIDIAQGTWCRWHSSFTYYSSKYREGAENIAKVHSHSTLCTCEIH